MWEIANILWVSYSAQGHVSSFLRAQMQTSPEKTISALAAGREQRGCSVVGAYCNLPPRLKVGVTNREL